jgi:hypothetical protein
MSWGTYCLLTFPADASTVVGYYFSHSCYCRSSAVGVVMFLLSLLLLASLHAVAGFTVFAGIPAFDDVHTVLDVLLLLSILQLLALLLL